MAYRKIKPELEHIDNLIRYCGLFTTETDKNGGYGCKSKSKQKQEPGCCFAWDCPLAYQADIDDLKKFDTILFNQYSNGDKITDWLVLHSEVIHKK